MLRLVTCMLVACQQRASYTIVPSLWCIRNLLLSRFSATCLACRNQSGLWLLQEPRVLKEDCCSAHICTRSGVVNLHAVLQWVRSDIMGLHVTVGQICEGGQSWICPSCPRHPAVPERFRFQRLIPSGKLGHQSDLAIALGSEQYYIASVVCYGRVLCACESQVNL